MSRQQGRGGMGSRKHGVSGRAGPSPKLRIWLKLLAKREEACRRGRFRHNEFFGSVKEFTSQLQKPTVTSAGSAFGPASGYHTLLRDRQGSVVLEDIARWVHSATPFDVSGGPALW